MNTSQQAYENKIQPNLPSIKSRVFTEVVNAGHAGISAENIANKTGILFTTVRSRLTDFKNAGVVEVIGHDTNSRGNKERVYAVDRSYAAI